MSDFFETRERLRKAYNLHAAGQPKETAKARGEILGEQGFLTEVSGRIILTAPARQFSMAEELPEDLAARWREQAAGNDFNLWLQGRFVEAEKANRNGAFWSTADLEFGSMSVKHGPLNWLHEEQTVVGCIADNAIIHPKVDAAADTTGGVANEKIAAGLEPMPRPYIAATSAMWKWVHPEKVAQVERAAADGKLWYSMECIAREMSCVSDETHEGCGKSFDYVKAMTNPAGTCEHIASRSSARRLVDPSFLGGAVIVPPTQPGWGSANVEIIRQAASLAEQTQASMGEMRDAEWASLMASVVRFASA